MITLIIFKGITQTPIEWVCVTRVGTYLKTLQYMPHKGQNMSKANLTQICQNFIPSILLKKPLILTALLWFWYSPACTKTDCFKTLQFVERNTVQYLDCQLDSPTLNAICTMNSSAEVTQKIDKNTQLLSFFIVKSYDIIFTMFRALTYASL